MTFKDILVQVDDSVAGRDRALTAADLAKRCKAHLTGVFLKSNFLTTYFAGEGLAYTAPVHIEEILKENEREMQAAAEKARMAFEAAAADAGVRSEWLIVNADFDRDVFATARRFDLTVFPKAAIACCGQNRVNAAELALASGGPVLVLPDFKYEPRIGRRVLVAWKGSRESARALNEAWPILVMADQVHALIVSPQGEYGPDGALQRHLERHGVEAKVIVEARPEVDAGHAILEQVRALDIDLVVMGLFGRTRFGEFMLGGASDTLLTQMPCPIFVAH